MGPKAGYRFCVQRWGRFVHKGSTENPSAKGSAVYKGMGANVLGSGGKIRRPTEMTASNNNNKVYISYLLK